MCILKIWLNIIVTIKFIYLYNLNERMNTCYYKNTSIYKYITFKYIWKCKYSIA